MLIHTIQFPRLYLEDDSSNIAFPIDIEPDSPVSFNIESSWSLLIEILSGNDDYSLEDSFSLPSGVSYFQISDNNIGPKRVIIKQDPSEPSIYVVEVDISIVFSNKSSYQNFKDTFLP